jgi:hypothetical protein
LDSAIGSADGRAPVERLKPLMIHCSGPLEIPDWRLELQDILV